MDHAPALIRRLPVGAEVHPAGVVHFRAWAPRRRNVEVVVEGGGTHALTAEAGGYFSGFVPEARAGSRYRYRLDGGVAFPDPASRFQPEGPHGPSEVVDPSSFAWTDASWRGRTLDEAVIYEMHVGTFTSEGSWEAAARELPELARLGITVLEVMPVAEFPGRFGWGYDGVDLFAPTHLYGRPDDFRRFVDRAHSEGLAVILDVVYNHLGPDGCFAREFTGTFFSTRYENEWGDPINFDDEGSGPVREFFVANAGYWVDEYHLDGLRLDATQQIFDASPMNVMDEITLRVREAAGARATLVVAENEPQETHLVRCRDKRGFGMDALWNDDYHHSSVVAATGRNDAYYSDYLGTAQELLSAVKWGYLYQGQRFAWQDKRRGTPALDLAPQAFVLCLENHDQVANSACGKRLHQLASPGTYRALTALTLLAPGTPMLFQGQEFASSKPFVFFADHEPGLANAVRKGRADFLHQFRCIAAPDMRGRLADPGDAATFERCKLDLGERETNAHTYALHRDLLALRREAPFAGARRGSFDGAVLSQQCLLLRWFHADGDRLLFLNLGRDLILVPAPEPLLAPPAGTRWGIAWSSENPQYGGDGTAQPETEQGWRIPGHAAVVLKPEPIE